MTARYDNRHYFEPIRQILDRLLTGGPLKRKAAAAEIWAVWADAVGTNVARHARPLRFEAGTLTVLVDSPAWHHQLRFLEAEILAKLNARTGTPRVRKLRFRVGD